MPRLHHELGRPGYPAEAVAFVKDLLGPGTAAPGAVMDAVTASAPVGDQRVARQVL